MFFAIAAPVRPSSQDMNPRNASQISEPASTKRMTSGSRSVLLISAASSASNEKYCACLILEISFDRLNSPQTALFHFGLSWSDMWLILQHLACDDQTTNCCQTFLSISKFPAYFSRIILMICKISCIIPVSSKSYILPSTKNDGSNNWNKFTSILFNLLVDYAVLLNVNRLVLLFHVLPEM